MKQRIIDAIKMILGTILILVAAKILITDAKRDYNSYFGSESTQTKELANDQTNN